MSYNGYAITFIRGHYEAYEGNQFIVSADTVTEIKEELDRRDSEIAMMESAGWR